LAKSKKVVVGLKSVIENFERVWRDIDAAVEQELDDVADDLLNRAIALSPQLDGDHMESGKVESPSTRVRAITFNMPYSVFLHEGIYNLGPISAAKPSTSDGAVGTGYLLRPFDLHKKEYTARIGRAIGDEIIRSSR
jgi:hypothetical protein